MKIFLRLKVELQNLRLLVGSLLFSDEDKVENHVPYISQFASPEFAEKILKDKADLGTDPNWRNTGAESVEEYSKWALTTCGMACTIMALNFFNKKSTGTVALANDALKHGVYKKNNKEISDMQYNEYARWISDYGLNATVYSRLSVSGIQKLLIDGCLVMASVNPNIRRYQTALVSQKGGHMILVTGYDKRKQTITLHNPSGFVGDGSHENHTLLVSDFCYYFAGRGISLCRR